MRVVLAILEFSFCKAREFALFPKQKHIARITGLSKQHVSEWLPGWLLEKCVIEQRDGLYRICLPVTLWRVQLRAKEGKQLELAELEAWLAKPSCRQPALFEEPRLQEELTRSVTKLVTGVTEPMTRSVTKLVTGVTEPMTRSTAYNLKEDLKEGDAKLKALNRLNEKKFSREREFMEALKEFLPPDVYENDGGKWRNRFRADGASAEKCWRVLNTVLEDRRRGVIIYKPGGDLEDLWKRFE